MLSKHFCFKPIPDRSYKNNIKSQKNIEHLWIKIAQRWGPLKGVRYLRVATPNLRLAMRYLRLATQAKINLIIKGYALSKVCFHYLPDGLRPYAIDLIICFIFSLGYIKTKTFPFLCLSPKDAQLSYAVRRQY